MLKNVFPEVFKLPPHFKKQRRMFLNFQIIVFKCYFFKHYFLSKNVKCTSPNNFLLLHVKSSKQPLASVNVQSGSKMNQKLHAPTEPSFYDMISVLITFCQICMQFNWVKIFWSRLALPVKELPCPTTNSKSCPSAILTLLETIIVMINWRTKVFDICTIIIVMRDSYPRQRANAKLMVLCTLVLPHWESYDVYSSESEYLQWFEFPAV